MELKLYYNNTIIMGKNNGKGGKGHKKRKNKNIDEQVRSLIFKEDCQTYGQIVKVLGNGRFQVECYDKYDKITNRVCTIRGKMRRREWVSSGDVVLVSLREFQDDKADIILKYHPDEVRKLKEYKEMSLSVKTSSFTGSFTENEDNSIVFEFGSDSDSDDEFVNNKTLQTNKIIEKNVIETELDIDSI